MDNNLLNAAPVTVATFNRASSETINRATQICNQRGTEYSDSWSLDNLRTAWLDNLLTDHHLKTVPASLYRHYKRLIVLSSMIDIKVSRLGGGYKEDTALDLINYVSAYNSLRLEFDKQVEDYANRPKEC